MPNKGKVREVAMPHLPFNMNFWFLFFPLLITWSSAMTLLLGWSKHAKASWRSFWLLQELHDHPSCCLLTSHMAHPSLGPSPMSIPNILLTPMVLRATQGMCKGIFLNKPVICLGQGRWILTLTSIEILPEKWSPCRLHLSTSFHLGVLMRLHGGSRGCC